MLFITARNYFTPTTFQPWGQFPYSVPRLLDYSDRCWATLFRMTATRAGQESGAPGTQGLLWARALQRIPVARIDQRLGGPIRRVGRRVDSDTLPGLRVPVIEGNNRLAKMTLGLDALIGTE